VTPRAPPRSATWLLERLDADSRLDPLIGDLLEEFAAGRSRLWYWRQASGVLALELLRTARTHALSFVAAVFFGCAFSSLWHLASSHVLRSLLRNLRGLHASSVEGMLPFLGHLAIAASNAGLAFISVWVVTRIHRAHQRTLLVVFVIALTAQRIPGIVRLALEFAAGSRSAVSLNIEIVMTALQAVFTLAAGLWSFRTERFAQMDRRTRIAALVLVALVVTASVLYSAWGVGALTYSRAQGYLLDAVEIASAAYLAALLWRRSKGHPWGRLGRSTARA
jgi:hypothetical protein